MEGRYGALTPEIKELAEFEALLSPATCRGARKALSEVGLADEEAAHDIRDLRDLAGSIKTMRRTFLQTVMRWFTIGYGHVVKDDEDFSADIGETRAEELSAPRCKYC